VADGSSLRAVYAQVPLAAAKLWRCLEEPPRDGACGQAMAQVCKKVNVEIPCCWFDLLVIPFSLVQSPPTG